MHVKASFWCKISFGEGVIWGVFLLSFSFLFFFCKYSKCFITVYRCYKRVCVTVGINTPPPSSPHFFFAKIEITQAKSPRVNFTWNEFHVNFTWKFHVNFTWISREISFMWISHVAILPVYNESVGGRWPINRGPILTAHLFSGAIFSVLSCGLSNASKISSDASNKTNSC